MTIKEFLQEFKTNTNLKEILEIRTYIPIAEKKMIFETILDRCLTTKDDVLICDYILKKMMFELAMVKYHTNLEIDITSEEDYDKLQQSGVIFHNEYLADYGECQVLFDGAEQELRSQYSIETSVAQLSNKLSKHIEDLMKSVIHKIDNLDMKKFGFEGLESDKFKKFLNKYGK